MNHESNYATDTLPGCASHTGSAISPAHPKAFRFSALMALAGLSGAALAAEPVVVTSDGTYEYPAVLAEAGASGGGGSGSFGGQKLSRSEAAGFEATIPAFKMSKDEYAAFRKDYRPKVPPYVTKVQQPEALPESVIGADRRFRLYGSNSYPQRAIGQITFSQGGGNYICSGWLVSRNTVITAGHCVHGGKGKSWSTNVKFYPGRDGSSSPYGGCSATQLRTNTNWTNSSSENFDYGAIKLNCTIGNTTGWFGWWWQSASQAGYAVAVSGYPGDKPSGQHWGGFSDISKSETYKTRYPIDTFGGQSGAPVYQPDRTGPYCVGACGAAIHAYGVLNGNNSGTRITQTVSNFIQDAVNAP